MSQETKSEEIRQTKLREPDLIDLAARFQAIAMSFCPSNAPTLDGRASKWTKTRS